MLNPKIEPFNSLVEDLILVWGSWMKNHYISNDSSLSFAERRKGGETCEELQARRQQLLCEIDEVFNSMCNKNE
jgi:hypothetical protein|tara:strand:- start:198 stop:419 length:222 start_codon:yes stop_codon:yes gene_type:complete